MKKSTFQYAVEFYSWLSERVWQLLPTTRDEWIALILFPFKIIVVVAVPLLYLLIAIYGDRGSGAATRDLAGWFMLSSLVLFLGSIIQIAVCEERRAALITMAFATVPPLVIFGYR